MKLKHCHNINDLRRLAKRRLPAPMFHYIDGGADDEISLRRNTDAFSDYELLPRTLIDVEHINTQTTVLGQDLDWPVIVAPTGMSRLFHHDGELAVAKAAQNFGTMYSLSTVSTCDIETVGKATVGPKMFQIYIHRDRGLTSEFVQRCKDSGYKALCLTVDMPVAGNRERDLVTGMTIPPRFSTSSILSFALHPYWSANKLFRKKIELANVVEKIRAAKEPMGSIMEYANSQFDRSVNWTDAEHLVQQWHGPFAIKGIVTADDAIRAAEIGATAVVVSNHAGRQLDGAPATIDCLPSIVDAVGGRVEIILDSGIRRGSHVVKALALGANACMVGRPYLYGLGAAGQIGVEHALGLLRSELERTMALLGCSDIGAISRAHIQHCNARIGHS
jgi:L-lactate dehydrogenase (cytochrome)